MEEQKQEASSGPSGTDDRLGVYGGSMTRPPEFRYGNALRLYFGGGDVIVEFGLARPPAPGEPTTQAEGVVGVAMPAIVARNLALQILHQMPALAAEMETIKTVIGGNIVASGHTS